MAGVSSPPALFRSTRSTPVSPAASVDAITPRPLSTLIGFLSAAPNKITQVVSDWLTRSDYHQFQEAA